MTTSTCRSVLMVDDDARLLDGFRRQYQKTLPLTTALGGEEGLEAMRQKGPFAVVVSDFLMPVMNGVQFLAKVREMAPDTVRIMLTGNADLKSAVDAVNEGHVFRFLTKPCSPEAFRSTMRAALEQYQLRFAETSLLQETLKGSLEVMAELLALANPAAFGRATRVRELVAAIVAELALENSWRYEAAAMLSQIGCVAVPSDVIDRVARGEQLTAEQARMVERHPEVARALIGRVPRLEAVAEMIAHQSGEDTDRIIDPESRLGARILSLALALEAMLSVGVSQAQAVETLRRSHRDWQPRIFDAIARLQLVNHQAVVELLSVDNLRIGMILDADVMKANGTVLIARGFRLNVGTLERLRNHAQVDGVVEPIRVILPTPPLPRASAA